MIERRPLRIILPGGSGLIGNLLARHFCASGDSVVVLSRRTVPAPWPVVAWDGVSLGSWTRALEGADIVVNLAGRSVDCRYNDANRREILESRTNSTRLIGEAIHQLAQPPRLWMNASTATIYRHALDRPMDELTGEIGGKEGDAPDSWRFSIEVATQWEKTFFESDTPRTSKIALRSAMVMSPDRGGVFDVLSRMVRYGLGGSLGSGRQYVSWIHHLDFVRAIEFLITREEVQGLVNLASPGPLPNSEFMAALREALGVRIGLPAAEWMLELGAVLLRTEAELVLKSRRVVPGRLLEAGFEFHFPEWSVAAKQLAESWMNRDASVHKSRSIKREEVSPGLTEEVSDPKQ